MTQSAVSKQIKMLEQYLNSPLFQRVHRGLELTDAGKRYLKQVAPAVDMIAQATKPFLPSDHLRDLRISVQASLSGRWFMSVAEAWHQHNPESSLELSAGDGAVEFSDGRLDAAIRSSLGEFPASIAAIKLFDEPLMLVVNPELERRIGPVEKPEQLLNYTLLRNGTRPKQWRQLFSYLGLDVDMADFGLSFEHFYMQIHAAEQQIGVALVPEFLVRQQLADGRLKQLTDTGYQSPYGYYLLYEKHRASELAPFAGWLERHLLTV